MNLTDSQIEAIRATLRDEVKALAEAAASWAFDGNTPPGMYQNVLQGIEEGDPEVMDWMPRVDWSGQWADGPDWEALVSDAMPEGFDIPWEGDPEYDALSDDLFIEVGCDYADEVIMDAIERVCRYHLD